VLSVFGGKITTYRRLAETALARLAPFFPHLPKPWTAMASLPGGGFPWDGIEPLRDRVRQRYPFLAPATADRFLRCYGTLTTELLGNAASEADLGRVIGADLSEHEVTWLVRTEWARTADDILWRRSKLGLRFNAAQRETLTEFLANTDHQPPTSPGGVARRPDRHVPPE
jgi:glycerol-3-phosphate dehydrogenase